MTAAPTHSPISAGLPRDNSLSRCAIETPEQTYERLSKLPPDDRRAAFFDALGALPPHSLARLQLKQQFVAFAPGPFSASEFVVLSGLVYPERHPSPEELQRTADHEAAIEILEARRREWFTARDARRKVEQLLERSTVVRLGDRKVPPRGETLAAHEAALEAEAQALERLNEADAYERKLRVGQPPRKQAAARNWLAGLRAKAGRK